MSRGIIDNHISEQGAYEQIKEVIAYTLAMKIDREKIKSMDFSPTVVELRAAGVADH